MYWFNRHFFDRTKQSRHEATKQKRQEEVKHPFCRDKAKTYLHFFLLLGIISVLAPAKAWAAEADASAPHEVEETGIRSQEQERRYAIPGGQSIGVLLSTEGVTVVGFSPAVAEDGSLLNPAEDAGLVTGDFITSINGETVLSNADISRIITEAGEAEKACSIRYLRNGSEREAELKPVFCEDTESWRIGLYVRDNVCGVGTLSFYDADSKRFAALGHEVADIQRDSEGNRIGSIIRASVQSIRAGTAGTPGEKVGAFLNEDWQGEIQINGSFGVYGELSELPDTALSESVLPIAFPSEVQSGPAHIYTVLEGEKIESFDVNIVKTLESHKSSGHGLILEITDSRLIDKCGGIVQGMSGSPIIQNGLLVGAVSHVFVNDPLHGYGCFAQWMLEEAEKDGA